MAPSQSSGLLESSERRSVLMIGRQTCLTPRSDGEKEIILKTAIQINRKKAQKAQEPE